MADKYIGLDTTTGRLKQIEGTTTSSGASQAGKIPALDSTGKFDASLLPSTGGDAPQNVVFTESVTAGDWINIYNNGGTPAARKAIATDATKPAHGYVNDNVSSGSSGNVYKSGANAKVPVGSFAAADLGKEMFLSASVGGGTTKTPPVSSGNLVQALGKMVNIDATFITVDFHIGIEVVA